MLPVIGFALPSICLGSVPPDFPTSATFSAYEEFVRIMPLGDSITQGSYGVSDPNKVGYRRPLYQLLADSNYKVNFVGGLSNGYPSDFDRDHEGHPGVTDGLVALCVYNWLLENPADIILLHIGTNHVEPSPDDVEKILDHIDQYEYDCGREIIVVLARIINNMEYDPTITEFNDCVEAMALDRIENPANPAYPDLIVIIDMENGAGINYSEDMHDNLHPNESGYEKMAIFWFDTLDQLMIPN